MRDRVVLIAAGVLIGQCGPRAFRGLMILAAVCFIAWSLGSDLRAWRRARRQP